MTRQEDRRETQINRRAFCASTLATSAGVLLTAKALKAGSLHQHQTLVVYPPMKIEGAECVMPGSFLYFNYPKHDDQAVLLRNAQGEFVAFSRKCAHLGCSIDFDGARKCLTCPCHRGTYDPRTGYVVYGPPPRPLDQIVLQMCAGGEVWAVGKTIGSTSDRA